MSPTPTAPPSRTGSRDYGYANARIRGMRSRLLTRSFMDELIATPDITAFIQVLNETEYAPDLEETLIHGRTAASVDEALKLNMIRTYQKVLGFLNDEAAYVVTTLLARWDVFNLKTILRGKQMHLTHEQISEGLLPAGQLTMIDLDALALGEDVRAVVDTAITWGLPFASALREGFAKFQQSGNLADVELAVDRYYADWASQRFARGGANLALARRVLGIQIDTTNLVMVMRLQQADTESIPPEQFFLEGGASIGPALYTELAKLSDIDEVLDRLRGTPYGQLLDDVAVRYIEENSLSVFERALEDYLVRRAMSLGIGDPLGAGVGIAYLWAKQNEITNLRIIVKGKAVGMPEERVRRELILV